MAIGGLVIAPLAVILGLTEVASKGLAARFCARLYISALAIVAVVILVLDQLGSATFTKSWPNPHAYYQSPPNYMLYAVSVVTVIITAIAVGIVMARSGDRDWSRASTPHVAAGVAALMLAYPGLALLARYEAKQSLPLGTGVHPVARDRGWPALLVRPEAQRPERPRAARRRRGGSARGGRAAGRREPRRRGDTAGARHRYAADETSDYGRLRRPRRVRRPVPAEPVPERPRPGQAHPDDDATNTAGTTAGQYGDDWAEDGPAAGDRDRRYADDYADDGYGGTVRGRRLHTGDFQTGDFATGDFGTGDFAAAAAATPRRSARPGRWPRPAGRTGDQSRQDLFGQIAIYTLLEDRVHEFDQLTERVVEEVRGREPDTLVFIVHAVPSAPMQRILYEVYRDRAAYEWHRAAAVCDQVRVGPAPVRARDQRHRAGAAAGEGVAVPVGGRAVRRARLRHLRLRAAGLPARLRPAAGQPRRPRGAAAGGTGPARSPAGPTASRCCPGRAATCATRPGP